MRKTLMGLKSDNIFNLSFADSDMKVYFIRHGESEYNVKQLINCNPKIKVRLTKKGERQVREVAKKLKNVKFDAIYTSPFLRAKETAEILRRKLNAGVTVDERLREINIGFEGKNAKYYHEAVKKFGDKINFKANDYESYLDVKKRVQKFLEDLKKTSYENVLVVTHEMVIMAVKSIFGLLSDEETLLTPVGNVKLFVFDL